MMGRRESKELIEPADLFFHIIRNYRLVLKSAWIDFIFDKTLVLFGFRIKIIDTNCLDTVLKLLVGFGEIDIHVINLSLLIALRNIVFLFEALLK